MIKSLNGTRPCCHMLWSNAKAAADAPATDIDRQAACIECTRGRVGVMGLTIGPPLSLSLSLPRLPPQTMNIDVFALSLSYFYDWTSQGWVIATRLG
jgi:hypothetical protein